MNSYFNVNLEFDRDRINHQIKKKIEAGGKGYVCVVDGNVLAVANKDENYRSIINKSTLNICDGSSIAMLAGWIHNKHFSSYTGPDIFNEFISKNYKQYFLGNTRENLNRLKNRFVEIGLELNLFQFEPLPFNSVADFKYKDIANNINEFSPDIIWVSLGAPKQEKFISYLFPHINKGVLFAIGAAFNLFLGNKENRRAPRLFRKLHLEWLFRVFQEPNRVGKRAINYLRMVPYLIIEEKKKTKIIRR
ncbi:MAG: WecB/TagA/CpsF family glycosyltransferase [Mangrovibacterium sp.]